MSKSERTRRDKPERTINTLPSEEPLDANFLRRLATAYVIVPGVQKRLLAIADRLSAIDTPPPAEESEEVMDTAAEMYPHLGG